MTEPQLIVLREGVFRPAALVEAEYFKGYDFNLARHVKPRGEVISPEELVQVQSAYLSERVFHPNVPITTNLIPIEARNKDGFMARSLVERVIANGSTMAKAAGVPYFSIASFVEFRDLREVEERKAKLLERKEKSGYIFGHDILGRDLRESLIDDKLFTNKIYDENRAEEWVLHPTVNLYVRKQ